MSIREPVPRAPSIGNSLDEAAAAQARELIRHHLARNPQRIRQVRRIRRGLTESKERSYSGAVGECVPEASQRRGVRGCCGCRRGGHGPDNTRFDELIVSCTNP